MNIIIKNNKEYKLIGYWDSDGYDSKGQKFNLPKENSSWNGEVNFISQLEMVEMLLKKINHYKK